MTTAAIPLSSDRSRRTLVNDIAATSAVMLYSIAVAAGFARVFAGWGFFDNLVLIVVLGHVSGLLFRRLPVPGWIAVPLTFVLLTWAIGVIHYRFTYSYLLPTSETLELFRSELTLVQGQFRTAVAPVLYGAGWDVLASIGLAMAVLLGDTFAFRAAARAETLVPGGVLFVFVAAVGSERLRIPLTVFLVAAGALAVIVLRAYHALWSPSPRVQRRRLLAPIGVVSALLIAVLAGVLGPQIPGASAEPLYETRGRGGGSVTTVVSPLVDIRTRLTNQSDVELFVMQASQESYWRSSALPQFDGKKWELPERSVQPAVGTLTPARNDATLITQQLRVTNLTGRLVPLAADPLSISGAREADLRWSLNTSTMLVTGDELSAGDEFDIESASPKFSRLTLTSATSDSPPSPIHTALPDNFPASIREATLEVTAGRDSPYEAALALQNWFRDPEIFKYSLDAQSGHSSNAIEAFLRERVGYCEQFAGTFAAMLRTIGIPTRVAVGFTPGTQTGDGSYSVLGKNSHAWPEVWFDGIGWVPFEPTPGRGAPGAEGYTGRPAEQDDSPVEDPAAVEDVAAPTTLAGAGGFEEAFEVPLDANGEEFALPEPEPDPSSSSSSLVVLALLAMVGLALVSPALVRRIRRHSPASPEHELNRLWSRSLAAVAVVGVHADPASTPREVADTAADQFPVAARPLQSLAEMVTEATYREDGRARLQEVGPLGSSRLRQCANWTRQIERATSDSLGMRLRLRKYFTTWA